MAKRLAGAAMVTLVALIAVTAAAGGYAPTGAATQVSQAGVDSDPLGLRSENTGLAYNSAANQYMAVWLADSDAKQGFYAMQLNALGAPIGTEQQISGYDSHGGEKSAGGSIAYSPVSNSYLVVWHRDVPGVAPLKTEIYGRRIAPDGSLMAGPFRISNTGVDFSDSDDSIEGDVVYNAATDEFLVVWVARVGLGYRVFGQRLSPTGAEQGAQFPISDPPASGAGLFIPSVAAGPGGEYLVAWETLRPDGGAGFEIFGQRLSPVGAELGSDFRLSETGADSDPDREAAFPDIGFSPVSNQYLVVWHADGLATDDEFEVFGQRVSGAGAPVGGDFRISEAGTDGDVARAAFVPEVAYSANNDEFLVTWSGHQLPSSAEGEIFGQRFSPAGAQIGQDFRISNVGNEGDDSRLGYASQVVFNPAGDEYLVTYWANNSPNEDQYEVWSRRLAPSGGPGPGPSGKCAGKSVTRAGTDRRDVIRGTPKRDVISTGKGNDKVSGLGGGDFICSGAGRDQLIGGKGKDNLRGGGGADRASGGGGRDLLSGQAGKDKLSGGKGPDRLLGGKGRDNLRGGPGKDLCKGGPGRDRAASCERRRQI